MSGLIHTGLGSSSIIAHVLHSPPPPPANSFVIGPAVINTHSLKMSIHGVLPNLKTPKRQKPKWPTALTAEHRLARASSDRQRRTAQCRTACALTAVRNSPCPASFRGENPKCSGCSARLRWAHPSHLHTNRSENFVPEGPQHFAFVFSPVSGGGA